MIPQRDPDPKLLNALREVPPGVRIADLLAVYAIVLLERFDTNRTRAAKSIFMPRKNFIRLMRAAEALGYEVPEGRCGWYGSP